jgi:ABC-type transport system involved in cytochrome bd biosynthesis fused ATPase/permease subunit
MAEERRKEVPWWVKAIVYVAVPVGMIVAAYKIISDWLMGPVNALKDLWQKQYTEYVAEMKEYAEKGLITSPDYQEILNRKNRSIQQTEKSYAQVSMNLQATITTCVAIVVAGLVILGISRAIIDKWTKKTSGQVQTAIGQGYIAVCTLAEDLAARGKLTEATSLVIAMQNYFNAVEAPFMQQQISYYQSMLPNLTGAELLYANFIITAYTTELAAIPVWFASLPPILTARR